MKNIEECSKRIEYNLRERIQSLSTRKNFLSFLKRKSLRYRFHKEDWKFYIDKSFSWITGQYALGLLSSVDKKSIDILMKYYDGILWVHRLGFPVFEVPDQIIHAEVILKLYRYYGAKKYLPLIREAAEFLRSMARENEGFIIYWPPEKSIYVDSLGMISDFCYNYETVFEDPKLSDIIKNQMDYVNTHGIDPVSGLPYHSFDYIHHIGSGSSTWGRGVGWYLLGLSSYVEHYKNERERCCDVVWKALRHQDEHGFLYDDIESYSHIDSSTTVMVALCLMRSIQCGIYDINSQKELLITRLKMCVDALAESVNEKGEVLNCSGECRDSGVYSTEYGNYFAQGYTLILFREILANQYLLDMMKD